MRSGIWRALVAVVALCSAAACASAQQNSPVTAVPPKEGDFVTHDFKFSDGQSLPEVRLHYTTLGTPRRDASGRVTNAVLILHGTNRAGRVWLVPSFAGVLFGPGQLLDASKYYLILPDQLGAGLGKSTKPSDGLRGKFPHYDYSDMVRASQILLTQGLQVNHLHLLVGASMGCMEGFDVGESNPEDMDAMLLLSCLPVEVASRTAWFAKSWWTTFEWIPAGIMATTPSSRYGLRAALGHLLVVVAFRRAGKRNIRPPPLPTSM